MTAPDDDAIKQALLEWFSPHHPDQADFQARMRKAVEAYRNAFATAAQSPVVWQPIATAPKNQEVWAFNGEQARMIWSAGDGWGLWIWADALLSDADPSPDQPTYWMPLPAAPTLPAAQEKRCEYCDGTGDVHGLLR